MRWLLCLLAVCSAACSAGPDPVARLEVPAPSLSGSLLPNRSTQPALVLLPASYGSGRRAYPVVYYLPGFTTDVDEYVDGTYGFRFDRAVAALAGRELIVVVVNGRNSLGGSFYVDSPVTGQWERYVANDVIREVEARYRIAPGRDCRGIAGESMGGFGALHLAMGHPDLFAAVYAISPALFDERGLEDQGMMSRPYLDAYRIDAARLRRGPPGQAVQRFLGLIGELYAADGMFGYHRAFAYAYAAAFAPAPERGPPFSARDDAARLRAGIGDLEAVVRAHEPALRRLRGIGLDIGRADHLPWIPRGARRFSALLAERGIEHRLLEHDGGHVDRLGERIEREMLPFFAGTLCAGPP